MKSRVALLVVVALVIAGCAFGPAAPDEGAAPTPVLPSPTASTQDPPSVIAMVITQNLKVPWAIAFLPDGSALVTERDTHQILKVSADGTAVTPVQTITAAGGGGEGGLLGIAVSPTYDTDQTVFIYYSTATDNRIAALKLGQDPVPIVTGIPRSPNHNGGRLHFGPDGYLYASTGDASAGGNAQDRESLGGKILRMTTDGQPAPGNPFGTLVWSWGHRNVQGFDWTADGELFATEFGQDTWDEINHIVPGANYGWPRVEGIAGVDGFVDPIQQWSTDQASCSGAAITGTVLVAACLRGQRLWLVPLAADGTVASPPIAALVGTYGRLREAVEAPDGSIWVTTSNTDGRGQPAAGDDKILRVILSGGGGDDTSSVL